MTNPAYIFGGTPRVKIPSELTDLGAFRTHLGLSEAEVKKIWWYRHRMYSHFNISKKAGKVRTISAPDERLKGLQRRISTLLEGLYRPRNSVHGFVIKKSVKTNASSHARSRHVVNVDLKDFFPSISGKRVAGLLVSIGVDKAVSELIARICCVSGSLPQGAPSSPLISNMICLRLDIELFAFAKLTRCVYTRYADDITFSSFQPPTGLFEGAIPPAGNFDPELFSSLFRAIFRENGFEINPEKTHYANRSSRQIVTGIKINDGLNVDRRYIRNISAALHNIELDGIAAAQQKMWDKYGHAAPIALHLHGRINWVGHVKGRADPVYRRLAARYNYIFESAQIKIQPSRKEIRDRSVWVVNDGIDEDEESGIQGTAFFLRGVGLVTAAHCVPNDQIYTILHPSKPANEFAVEVKHRCKHRDLAILSHDLSKSEYYELELSPRAAAPQDHVVAAGYPGFGLGDQLNLRSGTVSALTIKHAVPLIEVTQKLTQGMSGGPILNDDDEVVGIIHKGGPLEGRDFGIRSEVLTQWLAGLPPA